MTKGWQGKYAGFVGDRKHDRDPFVIILPEVVWTWTVPLIESNIELIHDFYRSESNYGWLYSAAQPPPATTTHSKRGDGDGKRKQEKQVVPFILALPNCLTEKLMDKAYWMPHEVLEVIETLIVLFHIQIEKGAWDVL